MTNILIIIFIFEGHIEKHGSVGVFLQNQPRKCKYTKDLYSADIQQYTITETNTIIRIWQIGMTGIKI